MDDFSWADEDQVQRRRDPREESAIARLERVFDENPTRVYFSRQLEVLHEDEWFHWVTNRALRDLARRGVIRTEERPLSVGSRLVLMWHRRYRYHRRQAARVLSLVEEYAAPNIGAALGLQGEAMVLEGFARKQFVMHGRNTREFGAQVWQQTDHDLDFIFERDGVPYGVEVKNTLGYMELDELRTKIRLCHAIAVRPVFVARMLPKSWVKEVVDSGGFALILKYQLYPWAQRELARRVREDLELPVDAPRALEDGTMERLVKWHLRNVNRNGKSHGRQESRRSEG